MSDGKVRMAGHGKGRGRVGMGEVGPQQIPFKPGLAESQGAWGGAWEACKGGRAWGAKPGMMKTIHSIFFPDPNPRPGSSCSVDGDGGSEDGQA